MNKAVWPRRPGHRWVLPLVLAGAVLLRLPGLGRSLEHDEVFTVAQFASLPWLQIPYAYEAPNNHIFHSLLVKGAIAVLGSGQAQASEWIVRLPALLAGIGGIAALYGLARLLGGGWPALWAALWLALHPVHMQFSQQARGYTLLMALGTCCALGAVWALRGRGSGWYLAAISGFLAVWSVPSGLYVVGAVWLWALANCYVQWRRDRPISFFNIGLASLLAVGMGLLAYLPIIDELQMNSRRWGIALEGDPTKWWQATAATLRLVEPTVAAWAILPLTLVGVFVAFSRRQTAGMLPLAVLGVPFAASYILGMAGPPRVYCFILPFLILLNAWGWQACCQWLVRHKLAWPGWGLGLAIAACYADPGTWRGLQDNFYRPMGQYLRQQLEPGDLVVIPYIMDSNLGYYSDGVQKRQQRAAFGPAGLRRLLFVARPGVKRFELADYLLQPNYATAGQMPRLSLPLGAFEAFKQYGGLGVYRLQGTGQPLYDAADMSRASFWRVYHPPQPGAVRLQTAAHPSRPGAGLLQAAASNESRYVLHGPRQQATRNGLLVLAYTKSGDGYASVYTAANRLGDDGLAARQMYKASAVTVEIDPTGPRRYAEVYLLPLAAGTYWGLYLVGQGQEFFGDWQVLFWPFDR